MSPVPSRIGPHRSRELLSESVRRRLLTAILEGSLVAGERLHDDELTEWLGVSRTPIRNALERLSDSGLVEMRPNRYTRVAVPTGASLIEALAVYAALHAWAAEAVADDLDEASRQEAVRRFEAVSALSAGTPEPRPWTPERLLVVDSAVSYFAQCSGNPLLLDLLHEVRVRLAFSFASVRAVDDPLMVDTLGSDTVAALLRRDARAVAHVLRGCLSAQIVSVGGRG